jgi:hypothetical protein
MYIQILLQNEYECEVLKAFAVVVFNFMVPKFLFVGLLNDGLGDTMSNNYSELRSMKHFNGSTLL